MIESLCARTSVLMENKLHNNIYPSHGACELCGEVDPCNTCTGVQASEQTVKESSEKINNILEVKLNNNLQEKINSILSSVIRK